MYNHLLSCYAIWWEKSILSQDPSMLQTHWDPLCIRKLSRVEGRSSVISAPWQRGYVVSLSLGYLYCKLGIIILHCQAVEGFRNSKILAYISKSSNVNFIIGHPVYSQASSVRYIKNIAF